MESCIDFVIRIPVLDHKDLHSKDFLSQLKEWSKKNLDDTSWKYTVFERHHYLNETKLVFCDECQEETTHISIDGDDFKCLVCQDRVIRTLIEGANR